MHKCGIILGFKNKNKTIMGKNLPNSSDEQPVTFAGKLRDQKDAVASDVPAKTKIEPTESLLRELHSFRDVQKLKAFLRQGCSEVMAAQSATYRNIFNLKAPKTLSHVDDLNQFLEDCVIAGDYTIALEAVDKHERVLIEAWVQEYLEKGAYIEAATMLENLPHIAGGQLVDPDDLALDRVIDEDILASASREGQDAMLASHLLQNDSILRLVYRGSYLDAANECRVMGKQLSPGFKSDTIPSPSLEYISELQNAQGKLLELIVELGSRGFHLYIERDGTMGDLQLLDDDHADPQHYVQIHASALSADDLVIDPATLKQVLDMNTGLALAKIPAITITDKKATEIRALN